MLLTFWHFLFPIRSIRTFFQTSKDRSSDFASCLWSDRELVPEETEEIKCAALDNKEIGMLTKSLGPEVIKV